MVRTGRGHPPSPRREERRRRAEQESIRLRQGYGGQGRTGEQGGILAGLGGKAAWERGGVGAWGGKGAGEEESRGIRLRKATADRPGLAEATAGKVEVFGCLVGFLVAGLGGLWYK